MSDTNQSALLLGALSATTLKVWSGTLAGGGSGASVNLDLAISGLSVKDRIRVQFWLESCTLLAGKSTGPDIGTIDSSATIMTGDYALFAAPDDATKTNNYWKGLDMIGGAGWNQDQNSDDVFAINSNWTLRNTIAAAAGATAQYRIEISVLPGV